MKNSFLKKIIFPVALLVICYLSFGLLATRLGFYLDDWYIVYFNQLFGAKKFVEFFAGDRPLFAYIYMIFVPIFKTSHLAWQLFAVFTRWLFVVAFWYLLKLFFPKNKLLPNSIALLVAVYPGFQFNWFSVMYSQVYVLFFIYILSYIFMYYYLQNHNRKYIFLILSIVFQLVGIAPMEYFYGLELVRPIIIFFVLYKNTNNIKQSVISSLKKWVPYFVTFLIYTIGRFYFSSSYGYQIKVLQQSNILSFGGITQLISNLFWTLYNSSVQVWLNLIQVLNINLIQKSSLILIFIVVVGGIISYELLSRENRQEPGTDTNKKDYWLIIIGLYISLVAMIPFVAAGFVVTLDFPTNRFLLALSPGIAIFIVGVIFSIIRTDKQKIAIISLLVGFSIGAQFLCARGFMIQWQQQVDFLQQLSWRVPNLQKNTLLLTDDLSFSQYSSGTSLTAPLNMVYNPNNNSNELKVLLYLTTGGQEIIIDKSASGDNEFHFDYRGFEFTSDTSAILSFYMPQPDQGCLRILSDRDISDEFPAPKSGIPWLNTNSRSFWNFAIKNSNLQLIDTDPANAVALPDDLFGKTNTNQWCYYYEKADLATQTKDWENVIDFYKQAKEKGFTPLNDYEWMPLLQADLMLGKVADAKAIMAQINSNDTAVKNTMCDLWVEISKLQADEKKQGSIEDYISEMKCKVTN